MRGATKRVLLRGAPGDISIHAPRAGSDPQRAPMRHMGENFNPRSPCGERRQEKKHDSTHGRNFNPRSPCGERRQNLPFVLKSEAEFQSTLPVRGATFDGMEMTLCCNIFQSTLPVRGATMPKGWLVPVPLIFQSTLPVRGATAVAVAYPIAGFISIHAPRAGSDSENSDHYPDFQIILVWLFVSGRIWLLILNISQSM